MPLRTFFALDIDAALRGELARLRDVLDTGGAKINFVRPENLHVTLCFLGDVADDEIPRVCRLAADVAECIGPIDFGVEAYRCIPPRGALRMVWAKVSDPTGRMEQLHAHLSAAFAGLGFREENRRFRGHITLARVKFAPPASARAVRQSCEAVFPALLPPQQATELVAYTSQLTPKGPIYTPILHATLGG